VKQSLSKLAIAGAFLASAAQLSAQSGSMSVNTKTSLYLAGGNTYSSAPAGNEFGLTPISIALSAGTGRQMSVSATGTSSFCPGGTCVAATPDGPSIGGTGLNASGKISGIQSSSSGFLAALFLGPTLPAVAPASFNFASLDFLTFAPALGQIFFVGDGFTSFDTQQIFDVPDGATQLYFGIADGGNFFGDPGYYDDNSGEYQVKYLVTTVGTVVPEPSTYALMLAGLAAVGLAARRRRTS
jgi:hypothetical protein